MGASASANHHHHHHHHHYANLHVCVQLVMPLYYTDEAVTEDDNAKAQEWWNYILETILQNSSLDATNLDLDK